MELPVVRLLTLGSVATGIAITGAMTGPVGVAVAGVFSGVLASFCANLAQPKVDPPGDSPEMLIRNHDLRKLVGVAIRDVILLETFDAERAARLASGALALFTSAAADTTLAPLNEQSVTQLFASDEISFDRQTALDEPTWRAFLSTLAVVTQTDMLDGLRDRLAQSLHKKLAQMLRAVVKKDFNGETEANGRGFASLQLVMMGRMVAGLDQLLSRAVRPSDEVLNAIRVFNENIPKAIDRHEPRVKDPRERAVVSKVLEHLNQLRPHLDKRLDELSRAVASEAVTTRLRIAVLDRRTVLLTGVVCLVALLVVSSLALTRGDARQTQRNHHDLSDQLATAQKTVLTALADLKKPGVDPAQVVYPPDVLEAAALLHERGSEEQRGLADVIARRHDQADARFNQLLAEPVASTFRLLSHKGDNWYAAGEFGKAIEPYEKALALRPEATRVRIALAWCYRLDWSFDASLRPSSKAIDLLGQGIRFEDEKSEDRARLQRDLGFALAGRGDHSMGDIENSIKAYHSALEVFTREGHPEQFADVQARLADAWWKHPTLDPTTRLARATAAFELAKGVYTLAEFPKDRAMVMNNEAKLRIAAYTQYTEGSLDTVVSLLQDAIYALTTAARLGQNVDVFTTASLLQMLGGVSQTNGDSMTAAACHRDVIKVLRASQHDDERLQVLALVMLVDSHNALAHALVQNPAGPTLEDLAEAQKVCEEWLALVDAESESAGDAHLLMFLAYARLAIEQNDDFRRCHILAASHLKASYDVLRHSDKPEKRQTITEILEFYKTTYSNFSWADRLPFEDVPPAGKGF